MFRAEAIGVRLNRTLNSLGLAASRYTLDENELKAPPKHS